MIPLSAIADAGRLNSCAATFNSSDGGIFWCGQPTPTPVVFAQAEGPDLVVLPLGGLLLENNSTITLSGNRPVVLAIFGEGNIIGDIDARSIGTTRRGPGASWIGCGAMAGGDAGMVAGGGGGSFGTRGSAGAGTGAGQAGADGGTDALKPLHGGCPGGNGSAGAAVAPGGIGGGAIQISAARGLTVAGTISTSGAGGRPGINGSGDNGASGGGSGGAILLEALNLVVTNAAKLTCNAGGGGGGRESGQADGTPGTDGTFDTTSPASGGPGSGNGGDGAAGAAGATAAGIAEVGGGGAGSGAGGGGLGRIRLNGISSCTVTGNPLFSGLVSRPSCP